ncbi:Bdr family repetitive protein [Borrelia sp. RT1S]|uniref:Bdr family repetitive protein n=1 Tax=Borrelia sp. RT1S TaxID=2898580 RepID=UPI001E327DF2|nr:Bdr family repetitive protein [Borrelia sp. RT1S]UGQ17783.1 Bdr family repetitive protein [Borrelia sp. RT1S]
MQAQALNTEVFTDRHVTQEIIYDEFVKLGMQKFIADDLSKRYYHNELTYKDLEYLQDKFDLKLKRLEDNLKHEIAAVRTELKYDIASASKSIKWMFGTIITFNIGLFLTLISMLYTLPKG